METLQGTVSHFQSNIRISGGGDRNQATRTSYITLFRIGARPVEFRSAKPAALADGDSVVVAGRYSQDTLSADAIRNVTTGATMDTGFWGWLLMAVFSVLFSFLFAVGGAVFLTHFALLLIPVGLAVGAYACYRAWQTRQAIDRVRNAVV